MFIEFPRDKFTVWDNPVPIIKTDDSIEAYITDTIEEPALYNELCHTIRTAPASTTITLNINTPGGVIDSALMIIDAINSSAATTVAKLTGTVASAGTIIALACNKVITSNHLTFMIHNYSGSLAG
jgi:ATP-dependent protease ClpP protease subunit